MKKTIRNLVASPYDIQTAHGPAIIPALGEITDDFTEDQIAEMNPGFFEVVDVVEKPDKPKPVKK